MFTEQARTIVILEWIDVFGNQRFRFGPGEKDVIWLTGPDRIKEKLPLSAKGYLIDYGDSWHFEWLGEATIARFSRG